MVPISLLLIFAALFFALGPFGSFPLNDDWVYALSALKTSENLHFTVQGPQSTWAIPQIIISAIWIKVWGFSHFKLRVLTLLIALAGLLGFDRLLILRNVNKHTRILAGLCSLGVFYKSL